MWQNWGKLQVKPEFSIQNWGKLQVKLEFCHVGGWFYHDSRSANLKKEAYFKEV